MKVWNMNNEITLSYYVKELGKMITSISSSETGKAYIYNYYNQSSVKSDETKKAWHLHHYKEHKDIKDKQYIMDLYDLDDDAFELWIRFN